ncbi:hypothetical protein CGMCC3_g3941 [Colletotrichum fructicola]|nr:uncharacterized protein CGMCC3_g3941 [Colletotrichum fructicola]KAE9580175.1 hypothetical protein CGMCC3_g3941 [Colletotrichum fructicola]
MEDFESRQKTICIPLFELPCEEIQFYDFRNRPVLPFLSYESRKVGGYGTVRKARIHEAHYSHIQDCKTRNRTLREFAIKELHTESKEAYDQEMELFRKIGARSESESPRHLIQLQFSYLYGDRYFLVFPWADGNLREFWAKHHDYHLRKDKDIVWFFRQCKGLARALQKVHILTSLSDASKADFKVALGNLTHGKLKRWGRHGDIKPENILWFEKYDEMEDFLVISDFGLTSFNTTTSRSINLILEKGSPRDTIYATKISFTNSRVEGDDHIQLKQDKFFIIEESSESSPKLEAKIKPSVQETPSSECVSAIELGTFRCSLSPFNYASILLAAKQRLYLAHVDVKRWR